MDMAHDWQPDFEQLVGRHQAMVFSLALRMTAKLLSMLRVYSRFVSSSAWNLLSASGETETLHPTQADAAGLPMAFDHGQTGDIG